MNGSFNAYLMQERPKIRQYRQHVTMNRNMMLEDDIKEYWGFYLLRGSIVRLAVCSRHEGASFIIVKGLKDAKRCSYLGELDSEEESEEISNEFEFSNNNVPDNDTMRAQDKMLLLNRTLPEDSLLLNILRNFRKLNFTSQQFVARSLLTSLGQDPNSEEQIIDAAKINKFIAYQVNN
jgi:hypothetical protein